MTDSIHRRGLLLVSDQKNGVGGNEVFESGGEFTHAEASPLVIHFWSEHQIDAKQDNLTA
jgi:hypothetical protein